MSSFMSKYWLFKNRTHILIFKRCLKFKTFSTFYCLKVLNRVYLTLNKTSFFFFFKMKYQCKDLISRRFQGTVISTILESFWRCFSFILRLL